MEKIRYNDYELLYLIKRGSDVALDVLLEKYRNLILELTKDLPFSFENKEDIFQECMMGMNRAIKYFDVEYSVLFYSYIHVIFKRVVSRFWRQYYKDAEIINCIIFKKNKMLMESKVFYDEEVLKIKVKNQFDALIDKLSIFERLVFEEILLKNMPKDEFVKKYNTNIKRIYNCVHVIKSKFSIISSKDH